MTLPRRALAIVALVVSVSLTALSNPAMATATGVIPARAGGGSFTVELADFQFPVANGCYQPTTNYLSITYATARSADSYAVLNLTVRDSIGRVVNEFDAYEETAGRFPLEQQLCYGLDEAGTYVASGTLRFETMSTSATPHYTDSFAISEPYTILNPPSTPTTSTSGPSRRCVGAKKALAKAKRQNKPFKVVQAAKKKKQKFC